MSNQRRNQYDKKDSLEMGDSAQEKFKRLAQKRDWQVIAAPSQQDIDEHWDYEISKDTTRYKVDVKSAKRISRRDSVIQYEWVWLELHGVRAGDKGWIYDGKADLIAFETQNGFLFVERLKLIKFIDVHVQNDIKVTSPQQAHYKTYQRKGRPDLLTLVELKKLETIMFGYWTD